MSIIEQARNELGKLCAEKGLDERAEMVSVRPLTPEEAIGSYVSKAPLQITTGVEKVLEADFGQLQSTVWPIWMSKLAKPIEDFNFHSQLFDPTIGSSISTQTSLSLQPIILVIVIIFRTNC